MSGPSITARRVAAYRLGFARVAAPYGDAAADETLAADVAVGQEPAAGRMRDYLEARTRFFDRLVVGAIGRGVRQIVVGAAGYDGRALRYARSGVRWFEVDHPATQRDKRHRLARLGLDAGQVQFVEADFTRDPIAERLTAAGLNPGQVSLFLLEGVAVYLESAVLDRVLTEFRHVARAGSRLAISVSVSGARSEARSRFQASVAALGEPARSTLEAGQATEVLARAGWQVIAGDDADDSDAATRRERLRWAGLLTATVSSSTKTKQPYQAEQPQGPLSLSALLSHALVAFTIELDNEAEHRLPHRTTNHGAASQGNGAWLTSVAGISKEAVALAMGVLLRTRLAVEEPDPASSRGKVARLTPRGALAQGLFLESLGAVEDSWRARFGAGTIAALRQPLETLALGQPPLLFQGLEPYPDNWRASVRPPRTLPFYPMVLHRGGYPDGS
jgi:methyltransferase (TIGR00027 family)